MKEVFDLSSIYGLEGQKVSVVRSEYMDNHSLAVMLVGENGTGIATITVNLEDTDSFSGHKKFANYAFVDINNVPWAEQFLKDTKLASSIGISAKSGWCEYPLYRFDLDRIPHISEYNNSLDEYDASLYLITGTASGDKEDKVFYRTIECDSETCRLNPHGICLAPLLTENPPRWNDHDGCLDYIPKLDS